RRGPDRLAADRRRRRRAAEREAGPQSARAGGADGARRGAARGQQVPGPRVLLAARPDGGDAERAADLLRRRDTATREVARARGSARTVELSGRAVRRRALSRTCG